jgi:hypothetical protein
MMMLTMLFSDKDDRSQEQVEILLAMSRGFRTVAKFLFRVLSVSNRDGSLSSVYPPERLIHYFWRIYYDRSISVRAAQT